MVYHRNTVYIWENPEKIKRLQSFVLILGMAGAGLEGFRGSENHQRVGRVDRRGGSSPYVAPFYDKSLRRVAGPEPPGHPKAKEEKKKLQRFIIG